MAAAWCRVEVVDGTGLSTQTERERDTIAAHVRGDPHEGRARERRASRERAHTPGLLLQDSGSGARCVCSSCSIISRSLAIRTAADGGRRFTVALCDLHIHLGASVAPHIMWSIAHAQGFKLPVKDYWEFKEMITVDPNKCQGWMTIFESCTSGPSASRVLRQR